jgi:hypothetical protein
MTAIPAVLTVIGNPRESREQTLSNEYGRGPASKTLMYANGSALCIVSQDSTGPGDAGPKTLLSGSGLGATAWCRRTMSSNVESSSFKIDTNRYQNKPVPHKRYLLSGARAICTCAKLGIEAAVDVVGPQQKSLKPALGPCVNA